MLSKQILCSFPVVYRALLPFFRCTQHLGCVLKMLDVEAVVQDECNLSIAGSRERSGTCC